MRFLILDTYYFAFLQEFSLQHPNLPAQPYTVQWRALMDECFGTANFYSTHLAALGHEGIDIVANYHPLQRQWAMEHRLALPPETARLKPTLRRGVIPWLRRISSQEWFYTVLRAQVKHYKPDILYVQDMHAFNADFLREVKPHVRLVVGQIASPYAEAADFAPYDLVLTSFPHFVERFRAQGLQSEYFRLGFEPSVLNHLRLKDTTPLAFVGGLSPAHADRILFLESVASQCPLHFWGYGEKALPPRSPLRRHFHGSAWGLDMYSALHAAGMTLNFHINAAEQWANNMRLFEATGVGSLLITDAKVNLPDLFAPGKEIVVYHSAEECIELIHHFLSHEDERKNIAHAGQARTLREHTYEHRMRELTDLLAQRRF